MKRGHRVWDQLERKFVTDWCNREHARQARDVIEALTPGASEVKYWRQKTRTDQWGYTYAVGPEGQMTRRFVVRRTRSRRKR